MSIKQYHAAWLSAHPDRTEAWLLERIADGFHVHHVDGDHENNTPDNLILVEGADHIRIIHGFKFIKDLLRRISPEVLYPSWMKQWASKGELAYKLSMDGAGWEECADILGATGQPTSYGVLYSSAAASRVACLARNYAKNNNLPWPVPGVPIRPYQSKNHIKPNFKKESRHLKNL